ncbi:MAG TPA: hypothetical protein VMI75_04890 [Polyangiaceae bacterium]|nr:hypothetical protein [Polyangiaceae bacterium]
MYSNASNIPPTAVSQLPTGGSDSCDPHLIPITAGAPTEAPAEPGTFNYLSPEALLQYCESRLQGIDTQINQGVAEQNRIIQDQQTLEGVASTLANYAGGAPDQKSVDDIVNSLDKAIAAIKSTDPGCQALPALEKLENDIKTSGAGGSITDKGMQEFSSSLSDAVGTLNSGAELDMINLQSLMSQRQSAVEMTTNMVQTLGDTVEKVVANIGH